MASAEKALLLNGKRRRTVNLKCRIDLTETKHRVGVGVEGRTEGSLVETLWKPDLTIKRLREKAPRKGEEGRVLIH